MGSEIFAESRAADNSPTHAVHSKSCHVNWANGDRWANSGSRSSRQLEWAAGWQIGCVGYL